MKTSSRRRAKDGAFREGNGDDDLFLMSMAVIFSSEVQEKMMASRRVFAFRSEEWFWWHF
jgi:hypothetical protein